MQQIEEWLEQLGMSGYAQRFRSLVVAKQQMAKSFELRAAESLAKLSAAGPSPFEGR